MEKEKDRERQGDKTQREKKTEGRRKNRNVCVLSAKRVKLVKGNKGSSLIA